MSTEIAEPSLDQQLEELFGTSAPAGAPGKDALSESGTTPPAVASPPAVKPASGETDPNAEAQETDPLIQALEGIEEEAKPDETQKPQLSDDQAQILQVVPTIQTAQALYTTAENYRNFTQAFEGGKFDQVEQMFSKWNQPAFDAFLNHIYTKKVASGEWVDKFIAEQEGQGQQHSAITSLQRQIQELQNSLKEKETNNEQQALTQRQKQTFAAYNQHVHSLFEQIKFSEADRPWVVATLNNKVVSDPKLLSAVKTGNMTAVNSAFKEVVKSYVLRDKAVKVAEGAKIEAQSNKRLPVGGASAEVSGEQALPDDVKQVPKGKEDDWMWQQIGKLKKIVGK